MGNKISKLEFRDKVFEQYDSNKNNVLDHVEIKEFLVNILKELKEETTEEKIQEYFEKLDTNKNKELSRYEVSEIIDEFWEKKFGK